MGDTMHRTNVRPAFTLVELLVVIVIIGILMSLMTAAAMHVQRKAKEAAIKVDITQIVGGLEAYKSKYGEYPPDFAYTDLADGVNDPLRAAARREVIRHLRKAFPRLTLNSNEATAWSDFTTALNTNYGITASHLGPHTALVFWLGGLPDDPSLSQWIPAGFHADPANPFQKAAPGKTTPRTDPAFKFDVDRLRAPKGDNRRLSYTPPGLETPYVYFKARKQADTANGTGRWEYGYSVNGTFEPAYYVHGVSNDNVCVPYMDKTYNGDPTAPGTERVWRSAETFQIVSAGRDDEFHAKADVGGDKALFRYSRSGTYFDSSAQSSWSKADFDNLSNFSDGTLEDEIQP